MARKKSTDLAQELETVAKCAQKEQDPKAAAASKEKLAKARESAKTVTADSVVLELGTLTLKVNKSIDELKSQIISEVEELSNLKEVVAAEREELERLHGVDVVASNINALLHSYELKKQELQDAEASAKKDRERADAEYEYNKSIARKKADDEFFEKQRLAEKKAKEKQEDLEKTWKLREDALLAKEQELLDLRAAVAKFPEETQKTVDARVAEAVKSTTQSYEVKMTYARKDAESEARAQSINLENLQKKIAEQESTIAALNKSLEARTGQVQDIAVKAVESASGRQALEVAKEMQQKATDTKK